MLAQAGFMCDDKSLDSWFTMGDNGSINLPVRILLNPEQEYSYGFSGSFIVDEDATPVIQCKYEGYNTDNHWMKNQYICAVRSIKKYQNGGKEPEVEKPIEPIQPEITPADFELPTDPSPEEKAADMRRTGGRSMYATKSDHIKAYLGIKDLDEDDPYHKDEKTIEKIKDIMDEEDL